MTVFAKTNTLLGFILYFFFCMLTCSTNIKQFCFWVYMMEHNAIHSCFTAFCTWCFILVLQFISFFLPDIVIIFHCSFNLVSAIAVIRVCPSLLFVFSTYCVFAFFAKIVGTLAFIVFRQWNTAFIAIFSGIKKRWLVYSTQKGHSSSGSSTSSSSVMP